MKKVLIVLFLGLSVAYGFCQDIKTLSNAEISFTFVSKKVDGTISGFKTTSSIDFNKLSTSSFKGSVEASTLETGNFLRNWSLRGGKYFDADNFPKLSFESTSITTSDNGFKVKGNLTIKSTTKPITITFNRKGNMLVGTTSLYSSDFGIKVIKKSREANKVDITLSFTID